MKLSKQKLKFYEHCRHDVDRPKCIMWRELFPSLTRLVDVLLHLKQSARSNSLDSGLDSCSEKELWRL